MKTIKIKCFSCGESIRVPEEYASRKGRCPHCGCPLSVPPSAVFALNGVCCEGCGLQLSVSETLHIVGGHIYCSDCSAEKLSHREETHYGQKPDAVKVVRNRRERDARSEVRRRVELECEKRLVQVLIAGNLLTQRQYSRARAVQKERGESLVSILTTLGFVDEMEIASAISKETELPFSTARVQYVDAGVKGLLPLELMRNYEILPLSRSVDTITLAMVNPFDGEAVEEVERLTGLRVNPLICTLSSFRRTFERYFG